MRDLEPADYEPGQENGWEDDLFHEVSMRQKHAGIKGLI